MKIDSKRGEIEDAKNILEKKDNKVEINKTEINKPVEGYIGINKDFALSFNEKNTQIKLKPENSNLFKLIKNNFSGEVELKAEDLNILSNDVVINRPNNLEGVAILGAQDSHAVNINTNNISNSNNNTISEASDLNTPEANPSFYISEEDHEFLTSLHIFKSDIDPHNL